MTTAQSTPWLSRFVCALLLSLPLTLQAGTGVEAWVQRYGGTTTANDQLAGLVADRDGNVIVTGHTELEGTARGMVTIKVRGDGIPLWTNRHNVYGEDYLEATDVAVASAGNVYVTGYSVRSGGYDFVTVAYSSDGSALWTNHYNGPGNTDDFARAVAVNKGNGTIYVTGTSGSDFATISYSATGDLLWTNRYDGLAGDTVTDVVVDHERGNVYVTGGSAGGAGAFADVATVAYSSTGLPLWTNRFNSPYNGADGATGIAVDTNNGNIYVAGDSVSISAQAVSNHFTVAYSSTGVPLWTNIFNVTHASGLKEAIAVDSQSGNVYVTGGAWVGWVNGNDIATIAYSSIGVPLWTNWYDEPTASGSHGSDGGQALAVDPASGNIYVLGYSYGTNAFKHCTTLAYSSAGVPLWTNRYPQTARDGAEPIAIAVDAASSRLFIGASSFDYVTLAYSTAGTPLWTNIYGGQKGIEDSPQALALDRTNGNVYVTGWSRDNPFNQYGYDFLTIAYAITGKPLWTNRYAGPAGYGDIARALAVDERTGRVYVVGESTFNGFYTDFTVITYSSGGVPLRTNRYDGPSGYNDGAQAVAVDSSSGRYYATGYSAAGGNQDFTTIGYSSTGTVLWNRRYDGAVYRDDQAKAIAVDSTSGNVYVTGVSDDSSGAYDYATVAYSAAGAPLWTNRYAGPFWGDDFAEAITVNPANGNVYVTGYAASGVLSHDFATVAYSTAGVALWTNVYRYGRYRGSDVARGVAVDSGNGNIYVIGDFGSSGFPWSLGLLAYSDSGTVLWTNTYKGSINTWDSGWAVALDGSGNIYVCGQSGSTTNYDYVTLVYSKSGVPLATNRYTSSPNLSDSPTSASCMAVTASGSTFVTGNSGGDFATIKYVFGPEIIIQPQNQTNDVGTAATFAVVAAGMEPLSYSWQRNFFPLADGANIAGANDPVLSVSHLWFNDAANYSVIVSNAIGQSLSVPATLTVVGARPHFTTVERLADGSVRVSGNAAANAHLRIEVSLNLIDWYPLLEFTNSYSFEFIDTEAGAVSQQFYRTSWLP